MGLRQNTLTMRFLWDIATGVLSYQIATPPVFVYGNTARRVDVQLRFNGAPYFLQDTQAIYMAIRSSNSFSDAPLADLSTFVLTSGSESTYTGFIDLFTVQLEEFMAETAQREALYQFTLTTDPDDSQSSEFKGCIVQNYVANTTLADPNPSNNTLDNFVASRAVLYDRVQSLSAPEQQQARENIGLGTGNSPTFTALTLSALPTSAGAPGTLWRSGADVKVSL